MQKICGSCKLEKKETDFRKMKEKRTKNPYEYLCSKCKDCEKIYSLRRYNANKEICIERNRKYKSENKDKINVTRRKYNKMIMENYENRIKRSLKTLLCSKIKKNKSTTQYLGTSMDIIIKWFIYNLTADYGIDNINGYGQIWEIDHTIPISLFDLSKECDICFSWMNLMPLECIKNRKKSDKIIVNRIILQELRLRNFAKIYPDLKTQIYNFIDFFTKKFKNLTGNTLKLRESP